VKALAQNVTRAAKNGPARLLNIFRSKFLCLKSSVASQKIRVDLCFKACLTLIPMACVKSFADNVVALKMWSILRYFLRWGLTFFIEKVLNTQMYTGSWQVQCTMMVHLKIFKFTHRCNITVYALHPTQAMIQTTLMCGLCNTLMPTNSMTL
jgi:hypothetical protein